MNSWRISDEVRRKIAAINPLIGRHEVAAMFGISPSSVINIRKQLSVPISKQGMPRIWRRDLKIKNARNCAWPFRPLGRKPLAWAAEEVA